MATSSNLLIIFVLAMNFADSYQHWYSVSREAMIKCHGAYRDGGPRCREYVTTSDPAHYSHHRSRRDTKPDGKKGPPPRNITYPDMADSCMTAKWENANQNNNYGSCMNMTTDDKFRYITSNSVPDFYMNPYCPIGVGFGYCTQYEIDNDQCFFLNLTCGDDNGAGSTSYGDVWIPQRASYMIPLKGDPTHPDLPGDMYDARRVGGEKTIGPATGVATNGISIQGPNDAGDLSIDAAGFQLVCGGHVTPPLANQNYSDDYTGPQGPPMYHFHKSPTCLPGFRNASIEVSKDGRPFEHAKLIGWAVDGFSIYGYQDINGDSPIVDECGGHFGPVDGSGKVEYHYHSRPNVPYHLACQGPALSNCSRTQGKTNYCHAGCGAQVCVQPGTSREKLNEYLDQFNSKWLAKYTVNDFEKSTGSSSSAISIAINHYTIFSLLSIIALVFLK